MVEHNYNNQNDHHHILEYVQYEALEFYSLKKNCQHLIVDVVRNDQHPDLEQYLSIH